MGLSFPIFIGILILLSENISYIIIKRLPRGMFNKETHGNARKTKEDYGPTSSPDS
jgi:hypothetical protein